MLRVKNEVNKLGRVLHVSGGRKLILRTNFRVKTGEKVLNEELKSIGKIIDVFGPAKNPYVSVQPIVADIENFVGTALYIVEKKGKIRNGQKKR